MTIRLRTCAVSSLAGVLMTLAAQGLAAKSAEPAAESPQRLAWRIAELEGEVAVLRRFTQQQDASLDTLQSALDASAARQLAENLTLAALWALVSGLAAWRAVRRPRR